MMHIKYYMFVVDFVYCISINAMESGKQEDKYSIIPELIIRNIHYLPNRFIDVFKCIDIHHQKLIQSHIDQNKARLMDYDKKRLNAEDVIWHKNGLACAFVNLRNRYNDFSFSFLYMVELDVIHKKIYSCKQYVYKLSDELQYPYFNDQGEACFYGYAPTGIRPQFCFGIMQYILSMHDEAKTIRCMIKLNDNSPLVPMVRILYLPALLKAFLKSTKVYTGNVRQEQVKIYAIDGVIIPDDYKQYKNYNFDYWKSSYNSFDGLPDNLKSAIQERYTQQNPITALL